ncbi:MULTISPECIES: type II toxin-antitoxin system Phd/YefM family antitoxin [unclassified Roseovarius]|uniref:type II toxin-antitoxin system Phd/YefM family antitoxin n=1 Tax=unclassified Roseovarius TaxID=2614913 RepID=UPI00273D0BCF|nr:MULTISPECIES: type II toxin-antitoxin system Phd/YefM family antitoxin [unclassified Roseovarius]
MKQASLAQLRRNLITILNAVNDDHEPLIVTRGRGKPVVMMSLDDYQAMRRVPKPAPASDSAAGLWKSLSEVDELAFSPRAEAPTKPVAKPPVRTKHVMPATPADTGPAFKRHPSR